MVAGSFLIVYKGDIKRSRQGNVLFAEGDTGVDEDEDQDQDQEEGDTKPGPAILANLIDFAHTKMVPGEGPNEGVLVGIDAALKLLDGRIAQIEGA